MSCQEGGIVESCVISIITLFDTAPEDKTIPGMWGEI